MDDGLIKGNLAKTFYNRYTDIRFIDRLTDRQTDRLTDGTFIPGSAAAFCDTIATKSWVNLASNCCCLTLSTNSVII